MSKVVALYHIVFCTKNRTMTITNEHREHLYRYIWKIIENNNCYLYRIGGIPNHIHILLGLNPRISLSDFMRDLKSATSGWLKRDERFPMFEGWGKEYFAATIGVKDKSSVIEYIKSQQSHHSCHSFDDELMLMCQNAGIELHEDDLK